MRPFRKNLLLTLGLVLFLSARTNAGITGMIDGVYYVNGLTVAAGWACDYGRPESVAVHLYAGGPAGTGNYVNAAMANLPSEGAVAAACGSTGSNYRFQIEIGNYQAQNIAKTIYVHGISLSGGPNWTIGNSGYFTFPDSIYGTIFGSPFQMRVNKKYAGAIDSFYWRGQHFVDNADHGRQWQIAGQFKGFGECYNPTEAGNFHDMDGPTSSSVFNYLSTYNNVLITRNRPAFWLRPANYGDTSPYCTDYWNGPVVTPYRYAENTTILSNYQYTKMVSFGYQGIPNVIWFHTQIYLPETVTGMQLERPSGSMPPNFSNFWEYNLSTGGWTQLDPSNPNEQRWRTQPVVLEDPSTGTSIGMYSPNTLNPPSGTSAFFGWGSYVGAGNSTSTWSFISRNGGTVSQGTTIFHNAFLALGTRNEVKTALDSLHRYFRSTGQVP
jgi:hypothetical protein